MADFTFQALGDGKYGLGGELNFTTVPILLEQASDVMSSIEAVTIDLANVSSANSAAMALLIEWKSVAVQNQADVKFLNVPKQIQRLAEVCGVESLIFN